jgi:glyoxylase-like metal-dependent hydrolase (beta-lactamase superfamily II)
MLCKALAASLLLLPFVLSAGALQAAPAAASFKKFSYGGLEITALRDGEGTIRPDMLFGVGQDVVQRILKNGNLKGAFPSWTNAFAVRKGGGLFIVDTGTGSPDGVLKSMKDAGIDPAEVNYVLLTHFHRDHIGGLLNPDGSLAFPNAKVYAAVKEDAYWLPEKGEAPPGGARKLIDPYRKAKRYETFTSGDAIMDGVETLPLFGHTPGHTGFLFESEKGPVLFFGDVVHVCLLQFPHPEATISYDVSQSDAADARLAAFTQAAEEKWLVLGAHLPFPGVGSIIDEGQAYEWQPLAD